MTQETISAGQALEPTERLLRDLRTRRNGLSPSEVARRQIVHGPNEISRRRRRRWPAQLGRQLIHPFALLLWAAAALTLLEGSVALAVAIVAVVLINALVAFAQEMQAERAIEALRAYLPQNARVLRGGRPTEVPARDLVPGDVILIEEGTRISADARLLDGSLEIDLSSLSGESVTVTRAADLTDVNVPLLEARDLVFSGTTCTGGSATAVVFATGMRTELGRVAALSERVGHEASPLERQVLRLAWIIAVVGLAAAAAFLLVGVLLAGLPIGDALAFAVGLLVANVPEGLLPTLTLALALAVRLLARSGALVKRLSAVEALGAATVICTDKTGTITQNRMKVTDLWTLDGPVPLTDRAPAATAGALFEVMAACNDASIDPDDPTKDLGDPTEIALLRAAGSASEDVDETRHEGRRTVFRFDPELKLMSTVDRVPGGLIVHAKGAPEEILSRCDTTVDGRMNQGPLTDRARNQILEAVNAFAGRGLRVLGFARRRIDGEVPSRREEAERSLTFLGLAGLLDPPRPEVPDAIRDCRRAGIRIIMITGDFGTTAAAIARAVGLADDPTVVTGAELGRMHDPEVTELLRRPGPLIFARASPEAKLRVADALKADGHVVAMTGDGVNDAPALRRADIGVAMGRSGTDVAREAATMILTDDNFATIVAAIREGRRIYDNIRKFIVYILAHLTPEVVPFLLFALSGGTIPLPITVLQILAIDLGTETLPALALGREGAEPGLMDRPPRRRTEHIVDRSVMLRAWILLGGVSAALVMGAFFFTLWRGGWSPGADVSRGTDLHQTYVAATTITFLGIVVCQIGTAFAARTERASLASIGVFTNRLLLSGLALALFLAAALIGVPPLADVFHVTLPPAESLLLLLPFPLVVWGADELYRWRIRARGRSRAGGRRPSAAPQPT